MNKFMKANEAPKNLYLSSTGKLKDGISTGRLCDTDIEYTSTDAFVEKAWDWIENNLLSSNQQDKSRLYLLKYLSISFILIIFSYNF